MTNYTIQTLRGGCWGPLSGSYFYCDLAEARRILATLRRNIPGRSYRVAQYTGESAFSFTAVL